MNKDDRLQIRGSPRRLSSVHTNKTIQYIVLHQHAFAHCTINTLKQTYKRTLYKLVFF